MMKIPAIPLLIPFSVFMLSGCYSTHDIRTYGELFGAYHQALRIMTVDTIVYDLSRFSFNDSLLEGKGERLVAGRWLPFSGNLPMSRIVYIRTQSLNAFKSVMGLGLIGLTADVIVQSMPGRGLATYRAMGGDGVLGGGSCPFVYAWNGSAYVRQGEAFGTALGRGLETSTGCLLPDAFEHDGEVRVRITDERPETHYINAVRVCAYEVPPETPVSLDTRDRAWPVPCPMRPLRAPESILRRDNFLWNSPAARPNGEYRDTLELVLPVRAGAHEGSLVVHTINTHLSDAVFRFLFEFLGDEALPYMYRIEHDAATIGLLKGWLKECGLHVDVWDGACWVEAGTIPPEANEVPFTRLVRIPLPENTGDSLRVRLRMLADTWQIDDVAVDWSPAIPLEEHVLPMLDARHSNSNPVGQLLRACDSDYVRLLPGECVDMRFRAYRPNEGISLVYACHASGYLYEWFSDKPGAAEGSDPLAVFGMSRIEAVESLLRHHDAFLSLVFEKHPGSSRSPR